MQEFHGLAHNAVENGANFVKYGKIDVAHAITHYLCLAEAFHTTLEVREQAREYPNFLKHLANATCARRFLRILNPDSFQTEA